MANSWRALRAVLLLLSLLATLAPLSSAAMVESGPLRATSATSDEDPAGARVIVRYKALGSLMRAHRAGGGSAGPRFASALAPRHGLVLRDGYAIEGRSQVIHGDKSLNSAALAARLAADPEVEYAVPDLRRHVLVAPNDPLFAASASISPAAGQWYLQVPDTTLVSAINAPAAWAVTTGSGTVVVADVDTGVRFDHPDLTNKLLPGRNFVSASGSGTTGWSADASDPGDWTSGTPSSWHGTQTSGLIGAQTNNGVGMASIGYQVKVLPVRALGTGGSGYDSDIIAGMLWAGGGRPIRFPTRRQRG